VSVTIRDVAKAAGVSPKTVSRVINDEPRVLAGTRSHVLATIRDLGFHPNPIARGLATKQTRTLGLIVPDISNPFFASGIDGCVAMAEQHDYNLFLGSAGGDPHREVRHVRALLGQHVSGIILWVGGIGDVAVADLMAGVAHYCPIVYIDRPADDGAPASVHHAILVDQHYVGELATQHLLSEGRRVIAYLGSSEASPAGWVAAQRRAGYRHALPGAPGGPRHHSRGHDRGIDLAHAAAPPRCDFRLQRLVGGRCSHGVPTRWPAGAG
jgi:LacI family transcriptional regulator